MDSTASENITGDTGTQEQKVTQLTHTVLLFKIDAVLELFAPQAVNLELMKYELGCSESETRIVRHRLDEMVKLGLAVTFDECPLDTHNQTEINQLSSSDRQTLERVWKFKSNG